MKSAPDSLEGKLCRHAGYLFNCLFAVHLMILSLARAIMCRPRDGAESRWAGRQWLCACAIRWYRTLRLYQRAWVQIGFVDAQCSC